MTRRGLLMRAFLNVGFVLVIAGLYAWWTYPVVVSGRGVAFDEWIFLDVGRSILETGVPMRSYAMPTPTLFWDHTPGMVMLAALVNDVIALRFVAWLAGLALALVVYATIRGWAGFVVGALVATSDLVAAWSWFAHPELVMALAVAVSVWFLVAGHVGWAGIVAAVAVLFKEFALLYVVVVGLYAGWRFVLPSAIVGGAWLAYGLVVNSGVVVSVILRYFDNAAGLGEARFTGTAAQWLEAIVYGVGLGAFALFALAVLVRYRRLSGLAGALAWYVVLAVGVSFAMSTKEPRWLMGVVPAVALAAGLLLRDAEPDIKPAAGEIDRGRRALERDAHARQAAHGV